MNSHSRPKKYFLQALCAMGDAGANKGLEEVQQV